MAHAPNWDVADAAASISVPIQRRRAAADSGLLLEEQRQLQCHLEALDGPHRPLTSHPPGAESPWTTAVLCDRREAALLEREVDALQRTLVGPEAAAEALATTVARKVGAARAETEGLYAENERLHAEIDEMQTAFGSMEELYRRMRASTSWRVTRPFRRLSALKNRKGTAPVD
jgi:hypothetical protein